MLKKQFNIWSWLKREKGFTLIEMAVSIFILGFLTTGLAMSVNTIFYTSNTAAGQAVSMRQVQSAGFWVTKDLQSAKSSSISTTVSGRFLDMDCYTANSSTDTTHIYYVIFNGQMTRYLADGSSLAVAQNIVGAGTQTTIVSDNSTGTLQWVLSVVISNGSTKNETGTYRVQPRIP